MLGESDIQDLDDHLGSVLRDNERHHENVQNLLQRFHLLLDNYNRLKSDYEEEKEAREKYKKLVRGQDRNPFVLVLVDGDGCLFKEHLLKAGSEGGITAATLLSDSIKELLHDQLGPQADQCRIMVRIYSNILGLSKSLARFGLVGHEARSLSPFAASFTRSQDLFDYVDAGDKKEGADNKIREMFKLFVDHNQCKHIFFAGCHDAGYLSLLTPYRGKADRITLLKAASFHPEYAKLDLPVRELPAVFMTGALGGGHVGSNHGANKYLVNGHAGSNATSRPHPPPKPICKYFQKGFCRYGNESNSSSRVRDDEYYAKMLPPVSGKCKDYIPINVLGERIDSYCPKPPLEAWESYNRRTKQYKLCNRHQLRGECDTPDCEFDHRPVESDCIDVMRNILRQHPCPKGGRCRAVKCYLGHICQKDGCGALGYAK
ncbi:hypothetical protein EYZ11_012463 [Aspergillus tanneri]|uniref:C3H1-type domain-containing protein n=1 Tax=Aspergillus tanneri TaxID=1220188 RepID=A0A4S3J061_9EURO|nr:hypothetical protein EYZ11_012463 [Aspergillus tanneri]